MSNSAAKDADPTSKSQEFYTPPPRKTVPDEKGELWGHDLYPERRGTKQRSLGKTLLMQEGKENIAKYHCEKMVYKCLKTRKFTLLVIYQEHYYK